MAGTSWPTLAAGSKAKASDVESKFDWIEGSLVPMQGGNTTDGAYDLGSTTSRWRTVYATSVNVTGTSPSIIINNTGAGSADFGKLTFQHQASDRANIYYDNSANAFVIQSAGSSSSGTIRVRVGLTTTAMVIDASGGVALGAGVAVNRFSADGTFSDNSDSIVPTQRAVKTYVDGKLSSAVRAYMTADQSGSAGEQTLTFSETLDLNSEFSGSAFKPNTSGTFYVSANIFFTNQTITAGEQVTLRIHKNGSTTSRAHLSQPTVTGPGVLSLNLFVNDVVSLTSSDVVTFTFQGRWDAEGGSPEHSIVLINRTS